VRSYTANPRKLRFGVVAAEVASGRLLTMPVVQLSTLSHPDKKLQSVNTLNAWYCLYAATRRSLASMARKSSIYCCRNPCRFTYMRTHCR